MKWWSIITCFSWFITCSFSKPHRKCFTLHRLHWLKKIVMLNLNMYKTAQPSIWKHFYHWTLMLLCLKFPFSFAEGFIWGAPSYIKSLMSACVSAVKNGTWPEDSFRECGEIMDPQEWAWLLFTGSEQLQRSTRQLEFNFLKIQECEVVSTMIKLLGAC